MTTADRRELTPMPPEEYLKAFLARYERTIAAARSHAQILDKGTAMLREQLPFIERAIIERSDGRFSFKNGKLCEIWDHWEEFQHHGKIFGNELTGEVNSVRGFCFSWEEQGHPWEFIDLDAGRSREYFMNMDDAGRTRFMKRFANREERGSLVYNEDPSRFPEGFVAFATFENGDFTIEKIVTHHAPPDGVNFADPDCASMK